MRCSNKLKQEWSYFFVDGTTSDTHSSYTNETYGFPTAVSHHRFGNMLTTFSKVCDSRHIFDGHQGLV